MKKKIIILTILLVNGVLAMGQNVQTIIDSANFNYERNQFSKARKYYDSVLQMGYSSADIYYNLGNAYFKENKITDAIYCYEKALKINPKDEDARYNLNMVQEYSLDRIDELPVMFYVHWYRSLMEFNTADGWAILFLVCIFFTLISLLIYYFIGSDSLRRKLAYVTITLALVSTSFLGLAIVKYHYWENRKEAIIFNAAVNIKGSPDNSGTDLFILHEGTKVMLIDELGMWFEIKIANGSIGWIQKEAVKVL